ncbi:MAG: hypothetical protein BZY80_05660 [SAR202 cluster bacterium Io17-Chloro-G2]|nr:MAG: hypothetical protein BZY80_05660 [SAR202 cluster bacterium Io17-Chloro-G2]
MTTPETEDFLETGEDIQDEGAGAGAGGEDQQEPEPEPEPEPPNYYVSFQRLEELGRSPVAVVAARRVESCPSMSKQVHELTDPRALITEIARHYKDDQDFIKSDMPLMEIVFRILLSRRNEPTSLTDLHYELTERWATPVRPINVTEEGLQRVLDGDTYYGFAREGE